MSQIIHEVKDFPSKEAIEYLSNAAKLECNMEFDSEFPVESIKGNFSRLVPRFNQATYYKSRSNLTTINLNPDWRMYQGDSTYVVLIDETPVILFPQIVQYRTGSKSTIKAIFPLNPSTNGSVDLTTQVATLRSEIEKIIKN